MKLNLIPLFLLLLFSCQGVQIKDPKVELQKDLFLQVNGCKNTQSQDHYVLSVSFSIEEEHIKGKVVEFQVSEELSGNHQKIFLKKDHLYYPQIFNGKDHKEYNMPECAKGMCLVELYVYTLPWKNLGKDIELSLKASVDGKRLFEHEWNNIKNDFQELEKVPLPDMAIHYDDKNQLGSLKLDHAAIKNIRNSGAKEVEAVIVWREEGDVGYREHLGIYKTSGAVQEINLQHNIKSPLYFAGMLLYKGKYSFETKVVTMDRNNEFFNCKK